MTITYLDSGVLIAIVRGGELDASHALVLLDDDERMFVASAFSRLELLPKAIDNRQQAAAAFSRSFFDHVSKWANIDQHLIDAAEREAAAYGLNALDALHVAAAASLDAAQIVTTEGPNKPIRRVTHPKVDAL